MVTSCMHKAFNDVFYASVYFIKHLCTLTDGVRFVHDLALNDLRTLTDGVRFVHDLAH